MKAGAVLLFSGLCLFAQSRASFEIQGTILEAGTNHGVDDAVVIINLVGKTMREVARLVTNGQGVFSYAPAEAGTYSLTIAKPGYSGPATGDSSPFRFVLNEQHPRERLVYHLERRGTISGRFVDADSRAGLPGFRFSIRPYAVELGQPKLGNAVSATTEDDGAFTTSLPPGRYLIETRPQGWTNRVMTTFTDRDIETIDEDYAPAFLPGGPDLAASLPLQLNSAGSIALGDLALRKEPLYRLRVRLGGECTSDDQAQIVDLGDVAVSAREMRVVGRLRCGSEALVRGMARGVHALQADVFPQGRQGKTIAEVRGNATVALRVDSGAALTSRVIVKEGAGPVPLERVRFSIEPLDSASLLPVPMSLADQRTSAVPRGRMLVRLVGLGDQFYVKQIRYNGVAADSGVIDHQNAGLIEAEIDSDAAAITGTVRLQDKLVGDARLVLVRWAGIPGGITLIRGDATGSFRIVGLAPGEYRLFAAQPEQWPDAQEPGVWQALIASAQRVLVARGEVRSIELKAVKVQ